MFIPRSDGLSVQGDFEFNVRDHIGPDEEPIPVYRRKMIFDRPFSYEEVLEGWEIITQQ